MLDNLGHTCLKYGQQSLKQNIMLYVSVATAYFIIIAMFSALKMKPKGKKSRGNPSKLSKRNENSAEVAGVSGEQSGTHSVEKLLERVRFSSGGQCQFRNGIPFEG